jgi:DNA-binding response OmpR family regulator
LQIDAAGWRATLDGREIPLGRQEFAILSALAEEAIEKDGYVGRADLLRIVEAYRDNPEEDPATPENLDNALSRLRRAFAHAAGIPTSEMTSLVETKRGLGHRLGLRKLGLEPGDIAIF